MAQECRTSESAKWKMADQAMIRRLENTANQFDDLTNQLADPEVIQMIITCMLTWSFWCSYLCFPSACEWYSRNAAADQKTGIFGGMLIPQIAFMLEHATDGCLQEISTCYNEWKSMSQQLDGAKAMFAEVCVQSTCAAFDHLNLSGMTQHQYAHHQIPIYSDGSF
jgi:hypothetical protein